MKETLSSAKKMIAEANMARVGLLKSISDKVEDHWSSFVEVGKEEGELDLKYSMDGFKKASEEAKFAAKGLYKVGYETVTAQWDELVKKGSASSESTL